MIKFTTLGDVYDILVEQNRKDPDNRQAWVDLETNTIWVLGGENTLYRFEAADLVFKEMTEQEIKDLVAFVLTMDEGEECHD